MPIIAKYSNIDKPMSLPHLLMVCPLLSALNQQRHILLDLNTIDAYVDVCVWLSACVCVCLCVSVCVYVWVCQP